MLSNVKHSEPRLSHLYINLKFRMLVNVPFQEGLNGVVAFTVIG